MVHVFQGYWLMVAGSRLLVFGFGFDYCLLVVGHW